MNKLALLKAGLLGIVASATLAGCGDDVGKVSLGLFTTKDVIIDAKVSLVGYERYCSSDDEHERQEHLHAHIASLRQHITVLSAKSYHELPGLRSLDFVFSSRFFALCILIFN